MKEKDITEKTLEAYNDVFADIVNGLLYRGTQVVREEALTDAQPFSMYKADGKLHAQDRDVSKYWITDTGNRVNVRIALLGIENQTRYDPDMPLRVIGYDGAAYRAELSQKERYPVITLVLYFGNTHWGTNRTLYDVLKVPELLNQYVNNYRINLFEIAFLPEEAIDYFHSDFKVIADYFIRRRLDSKYRPTDPIAFQHVEELLELMSALTQDSRYFELTDEKGERPKNMCEMLDQAEARGISIGETRGKEEGKLECIRNAMASLEISAAQAMEILKVSSEERPRLMERL